MVKTQDSATIKRTLYFFWQITKKRPWPFALGVIATIGFIGMLTYANTYVMSLIVDRIQLGPVGPDQVWEVFGPYIIALILVNVVGQVCSKLQDYAIFKTEINGNYNLARLCFDTLSNQSMTFHTNRFGGSLVSQTTKFMTSYSLLVETTLLSLLPTVIAIVCTIGILAPIVPSYVAVLTVMLVIYIAVAYIMFRKITPLSAAAAAAQNRLSGVLSDSVTNILAVKTYGREDYERSLFTDASLEAMRADSRSMRATIKRGIMTSSLIVVIMSIVSIFTAGGNAWFGISAGTLVMMFTYTYNLTMRFNMINSMLARLNKVFGDASEMTRILDEPRLVSDVPNAPALQVEAGNIDFEHIGFTYEDSANATPVFTDLNLHIPGGQRVGLVGQSGSGKTTLTKLLLRLSDVQQGEVLVDGQDILEVFAAKPAPSDRLRAAGGAALSPQHSREHLLRQTRCNPRRDRCCCGKGERARIHRAAAQRLRHDGGGTWHQALRWPAPTHRDRARYSGRCAHPRAGRGYQRARLRKRGARAGCAGEPHARAHVHCGGTPSFHRGLARSHRGAGQRQDRRGRHARKPDRCQRRIRASLGSSDRCLPRMTNCPFVRVRGRVIRHILNVSNYTTPNI